MKKLIRKITKNYWIIAFFLSLLLGAIIVLPNIIVNNGVYTFIGDYNSQQIPFNIAMNHAIKSGGYIWNWYNDLGTSFIGSYGLYNVFSPFTMILWLFPTSFVPYLMGPMLILKYAIAGLTSYLYLSKHVKHKKFAILGSLLYSFSGFQITNTLFYHFHDVVALFPLLLYSLDSLVKDKKRGLFLISVAINAITNYYFFIGEVVFVILYYFVMIGTKQYKWSWKSLITIFLESIIGVLISFFILFPSILFVLGNPRVDTGWTSLLEMIKPLGRTVLEITRALIMPNESMNFRGIISSTNYSSVEAYLPFVGAILWLTYLIKKPKDWKSILLIIILIFMYIPILNSSFSAFTTTYYARWFYMATLIMALISAKTLEEKMNIIPGIIGIIGIVGLFFALSSYCFRIDQFIYNQTYFTITFSVLFINIFALYLIIRFTKKKCIYIIVAIFIYVGLFGNYFIYYNKQNANAGDVLSNYKIQANTIEKLEDNVRYNTSNCLWNIGLLSNKMIINSWNSNVEGSAFQFYDSIGLRRGVATQLPIYNKDLQTFLSVKYIISCSLEDNELEKIYGKPQNLENCYIYENDSYKPLGVDYSFYILKENFEKLNTEEKIEVLNYAIVLENNQVKKYSELLEEYDSEKVVKSTIESNKFKITNSGFKAVIHSKENRVLLYTIPYSKGWKAYINNKEVKIEKVDNGMMAIPINKGQNEIEFLYKTPGSEIGKYISITGLMIYLGYILYITITKYKLNK